MSQHRINTYGARRNADLLTRSDVFVLIPIFFTYKSVRLHEAVCGSFTLNIPNSAAAAISSTILVCATEDGGGCYSENKREQNLRGKLHLMDLGTMGFFLWYLYGYFYAYSEAFQGKEASRFNYVCM